MKKMAWLALALVACAPFNQGGVLNPIIIDAGGTVAIGPSAELHVAYNHDLQNLEGVDFAQAFATKNKLTWGESRRNTSLSAETLIDSPWNTSVLDNNFTASVSRQLEHLSTSSIYEKITVAPLKSEVKFAVKVPLNATGSKTIIVKTQLGSKVVKAVAVLTVSSRSSSSETIPFQLETGDQIDVVAGKTTYINMRFDRSATDILVNGYIENTSSASTMQASFAPSLSLSSLPKGLKVGISDTTGYVDIDSDVERINSQGYERTLDFVPTLMRSQLRLNTEASFTGGEVRGLIGADGRSVPMSFNAKLP